MTWESLVAGLPTAAMFLVGVICVAAVVAIAVRWANHDTHK